MNNHDEFPEEETEAYICNLWNPKMIEGDHHFIQKISKKSLYKKDLTEVERFMQMLNKPEQIAHLPGKDGLERQ